MLHEPALLLLDEPTAGVDPKARREFWDELHVLASRGVSVLVSTHYMDEAERCHKLAYISYGKLMTQGTAAEIVAEQKLSTWVVSGGDLAAISADLHGRPGVDQTAIFGAELHVTGTDDAALEATLRREAQAKGLQIRRADVGLEDVFISLMTRSADNFGPPS
jgi:ABC-2 type transport system ATP-binding protein